MLLSARHALQDRRPGINALFLPSWEPRESFMSRPSGSGCKRRCPEPARRSVSRIAPSSTRLRAPVLTSSCFTRIFGSTDENSTSRYRFINGVCTHVNGQDDVSTPASQFVETLLKNVSIPTLIVAEVPMYVSTLVLDSPGCNGSLIDQQ